MKTYWPITRSSTFSILTTLVWIVSITTSPAASLVQSGVSAPAEDAYVRSGFSNQKKNFGSDATLEIENGKNEAEAYIKLDLAGVDAFTKQAKLRFYAVSQAPNVATISIKLVADNGWSETTVTWKDKPIADKTVAQVQLVGTTPSWYEVELTSAIKAAQASQNSQITLAFVLSDSDPNKVTISSRENSENKPELVLYRSTVNVRLSFRPTEKGAPPGYIVDSGTVYSRHSNGYTYGWNQDVSKFVFDRNQPDQAQPKQARSPDLRYSTGVAMDSPDLPKQAFWGISLPNGKYNVHLVAGDPGMYDSVYGLNINDALVLEGIPDQTKRWAETSKPVEVTNGKLIITSNPKAINNKLCFVEIQEIRETGK
jgi:hypothetical protein